MSKTITALVGDISEHLTAEVDDGVLHIRLARPKKLNALTGDMIDGLSAAVRWAAVSPLARSVVLSAEGRAFSVGDDLSGLGPRMGVESAEAESIDAFPHVVTEILRIRKPVIVALQGAVYGAGMEIALACDLRVGDTTTRFGPVYTSHAMAAGTTLLPMFVGVPAARRILLLAEPIPADQALALGLLDELSPEGESLRSALTIAARLAHGPTRAYGLVKSALLEGIGRGPLENLHAEENMSYQASLSDDAAEGLRAFEEKREPVYRGQ